MELIATAAPTTTAAGAGSPIGMPMPAATTPMIRTWRMAPGTTIRRTGRELADRELDAQGEQQEDDADLGELADLGAVADEAGRERPDDDAREEVADDRGLAQPDGDDPADQRECDRDAEVHDEPQVVGDGESQLGQGRHVPP